MIFSCIYVSCYLSIVSIGQLDEYLGYPDLEVHLLREILLIHLQHLLVQGPPYYATTT